jgi:hypothetical protein
MYGELLAFHSLCSPVNFQIWYLLNNTGVRGMEGGGRLIPLVEYVSFYQLQTIQTYTETLNNQSFQNHWTCLWIQMSYFRLNRDTN